MYDSNSALSTTSVTHTDLVLNTHPESDVKESMALVIANEAVSLTGGVDCVLGIHTAFSAILLCCLGYWLCSLLLLLKAATFFCH